jgi:arginine deiminase
MLFEDIPFLEQMQEEHDLFADVLRGQGCRVHYVESLLEEVLSDRSLRLEVVDFLVESAQLFSPSLQEIVRDHLLASDSKELVSYCIGGLLKSAVDDKVRQKTLSYYIRDAYPYYISPLPNLYFTRDPATMVRSGISINVMKTESRRRENWIISLLANHHPLFSQTKVHSDFSYGNSIEGGDILILNEHCAVVGSSARTGVWAIEAFAKRMMAPLEEGGEDLKEVLVVQIPFTRAYMHLDTVFTMVDRDKFSIFGGIEPSLRVFSLRLSSRGGLTIGEEPNLASALKRVLAVPSVELIKSGGSDSIASAREQWNDSTNTLAVAPGTVVTYRRNTVSNETLEKHGITVIPIRGSELVRGRGGPRCMSMPLARMPM